MFLKIQESLSTFRFKYFKNETIRCKLKASRLASGLKLDEIMEFELLNPVWHVSCKGLKSESEKSLLSSKIPCRVRSAPSRNGLFFVRFFLTETRECLLQIIQSSAYFFRPHNSLFSDIMEQTNTSPETGRNIPNLLWGQSMKILIADDSTAVRQRLTEMLSEIEGVEIAGEAGDGEEAMELFQKHRPDAIILDIRMPKSSGMDVLKYIKGKHHETQVLILTNYPFPQYRNKCLKEGADYFFNKSDEFSRIVDVIKGMLPAPV
ncbi:response regulator [bacterium]|nr:MAG: response regulator [bacterium]